MRTNCKAAVENIRHYIAQNFKPENYTDTPPQGFGEIAEFIMDVFHKEKWNTPDDYRYYSSENVAFEDWCAGLPSVLDTCYFYNRSAVDDLAEILDEGEEERSRYTEAEAERLLTALIYRELKKGAAN